MPPAFIDQCWGHLGIRGCGTEGLWVESEVRLFKDYIQDRSTPHNSKVTWLAPALFNLFNDESWIHCSWCSVIHLFNNTKPSFGYEFVGKNILYMLHEQLSVCL